MYEKVSDDDPKDRRYLFRIYNPNGLDYYKILEFSSDRKAKDDHDKIRLELREGKTATTTEKATKVIVYVQAMVDSRTLKPNTRIAYAKTIKHHIGPRLGHLRIGQLENQTTLFKRHFKEVGQTAGKAAQHRFEQLVREMLALAVLGRR